MLFFGFTEENNFSLEKKVKFLWSVPYAGVYNRLLCSHLAGSDWKLDNYQWGLEIK